MTETRDGWSAGGAYEEFMGRWSRRLARSLVAWLDLPAGLHWLDVGCGTGALTAAVCDGARPASVLGCDPSPGFIDHARMHCTDVRASFVVADDQSLPARPGGYQSVTSLLALNFFPDHLAAVRGMAAVSRRGATISACVWDYRGRMEFLRRFWDAVIAADPDARRLDEGTRFPICRREALRELFGAAGLVEISIELLEIPTVFESFADYWSPLLGGTGPAPTYVASLDPQRRTALARRLDDTLPRDRDGRIALVAGAWAVRGTVA